MDNIVPESYIISGERDSSTLCKGCRSHKPIEHFTDMNTGRNYRRCNGCRSRDYARRNRGAVPVHQIFAPDQLSNRKINLSLGGSILINAI